MQSYIQKAGHEWQKQQQSATAAHLLEGHHEAGTTSLRDYVKLVAEKAYFKELRALTHSSKWEHLKQSDWTLAFECLCFRMLSRMGCAVHQLLVAPTHGCPYKVFRLVTDNQEAAQRLLDLSECCLDSFSKTFLATYRHNLHSKEQSTHWKPSCKQVQ